MTDRIGKDTAADMAAIIDRTLSDDQSSRLIDHPDFPAVSLRLMDNWAPHAEDDASMTRTLRDIGHYLAGVWALALHGSSAGLSHISLSQVAEPLGLGSRTRIHAMLIYLQVIGMIRPAPVLGDARYKRYTPTPALRDLFHARFRRELTIASPLIPDAAAVLARWNEPGVFEIFMASTARFMAASYLNLDRKKPSLDLLGQRNAGLTVMGQLVTMADQEFPPRSAELNLSELAKRSGVSRQHARNVLKVGQQAGFWRSDGDNRLLFTAEFHRQLSLLMAFYVLHMAWCARQALEQSDARGSQGELSLPARP